LTRRRLRDHQTDVRMAIAIQFTAGDGGGTADHPKNSDKDGKKNHY
jgi:hypothetical protein